MTRFRLQLLLVVLATAVAFVVTLKFPSQNLTPFIFVPTLVSAAFAPPVVVALVGSGAVVLSLVTLREGIMLAPSNGLIIRIFLVIAVLAIAVWLAWVRQRKEQELFRLSTTDSLTGLPNRSHLTSLIEAAAPKASTSNPLTLAFLDLDSFKDINDDVGHLAGDAVLLEVAQRLRRSSEPGVVARFGGDEFVVLTTDATSGADPQTFCQRQLDAIRAPMSVGDQEFRVTASAGVACITDPNWTVDDVIRLADHALYRAKFDDARQVVIVKADRSP